ncbi:MAG: hypothetical protein GXP41_11400 [Chloroflexi bacterium]|nr:hypothetical protein [Chloroflexota bacterium]
MIYRLYGLTLSTDFRFANHLLPGTGTPDLTFACVDQPPDSSQQDATVYTSPYRAEDGESVLVLRHANNYDILHFAHTADFYVWPERILCHLLNPDYDYLVEIHLLGPVLSFWLERQGLPALHAAAVVVDDRAIAFLSANKGGKSSLAAAFMQAGFPLLSDDIVPVERAGGAFVGRPGYPQMRLWPEEAQHFLGCYEDLDLVHPMLSKRRVPVGGDGFGDFCDHSQPLACLYLPERRDPANSGAQIEIVPVSPRDAVFELIRHSFAVRMAEAVGLAAQRLDFFAQMAGQVPVRRLVYPSGFEHLPRVRDAVLADLQELHHSG